MKTVYTLGKQVSINGIALRTVLIAAPNTEVQSIFLPEAEAVALVNQHMERPPLWIKPNGWIDEASLMGLMQRLHVAALDGTQWLGHSTAKYVNVKVDMRDGSFMLTDAFDHEAKTSVAELTGAVCKQV